VNATGTWAQTSPKFVWLSVDRVSDLTQVVEARATAMCKQPVKSLMPSVLVKKLRMNISAHGVGTFQLKMTGVDEAGNKFTYGYTVKGLVQQP